MSFFRLVPNLTIMAPKDFKELEEMLEFAVNLNKPVVIRYPRGGEDEYKIEKQEKIQLGKAEIEKEGKDLTIIAIGKTVAKAMKIAEEMEKEQKDISVEVINTRFLKPIDKETISKSIEKTKKIITIEDGTIINGLATAIQEIIIEKNLQEIKMKNYAYPDKYIQHGSIEELEKKYGLDKETIKKDWKRDLRNVPPIPLLKKGRKMDKQQLLKDYKKQEDKMCLSQVLDKMEFSKNREKIEYTDFLDMYQVSLVENFFRKIKFENYQLYGGYEEAERKVAIIYPEKYDEKMLKKNYNKIVKVVRILLPEEEKGKYSHRNYLGGIVKLGLKREKVGDIIVCEKGADIITLEDFADILKQQLPILTRFENSKINIEEIQNLQKRELKVEQVKIIVPSLRLDNFVSDLARTSRSKAVQILKQERVFVNRTK